MMSPKFFVFSSYGDTKTRLSDIGGILGKVHTISMKKHTVLDVINYRIKGIQTARLTTPCRKHRLIAVQLAIIRGVNADSSQILILLNFNIRKTSWPTFMSILSKI